MSPLGEPLGVPLSISLGVSTWSPSGCLPGCTTGRPSAFPHLASLWLSPLGDPLVRPQERPQRTPGRQEAGHSAQSRPRKLPSGSVSVLLLFYLVLRAGLFTGAGPRVAAVGCAQHLETNSAKALCPGRAAMAAPLTPAATSGSQPRTAPSRAATPAPPSQSADFAGCAPRPPHPTPMTQR